MSRRRLCGSSQRRARPLQYKQNHQMRKRIRDLSRSAEGLTLINCSRKRPARRKRSRKQGVPFEARWAVCWQGNTRASTLRYPTALYVYHARRAYELVHNFEDMSRRDSYIGRRDFYYFLSRSQKSLEYAKSCHASELSAVQILQIIQYSSSLQTHVDDKCITQTFDLEMYW